MVILNKKQDESHGATTAPFKNPSQSQSVKKRLKAGSNSGRAEIQLNQPTRLTDLEINEILKAVLGCTEHK